MKTRCHVCGSRECGLVIDPKADDYICPGCVFKELARKDAEIARLARDLEQANASIQRQRSSFKMGLDSASSAAYKLSEQLRDLKRRNDPNLVDSERAANEILTNELEALRRNIGEWASKAENALVAAGLQDLYDQMNEEAEK